MVKSEVELLLKYEMKSLRFHDENYKEVSEILVHIVSKASIKVNEIYSTNKIRFKKKIDNSPVTTADTESNRIIINELNKYFKNCLIISEEEKSNKYNKEKEFFLVDPLDGTKEFIKKNGEFTINIGLIQNKNPILGAVDVPAKSLTYYTDGKTSFKKTKQKKKKIKVKRNSYKTVLISRSHLDKQTYFFLQQLKDYKTIKVGSSLKFCLLAEGSADCYVRFGNTMEWDTAAGHAILKAAGGSVIDKNFKKLEYSKKKFKNNDFFAFNFSNELYKNIFIDVLKKFKD